MMVRTGGMDSCAAEEELAASATIQLPGDSGTVALVQICCMPLSCLPALICVADDGAYRWHGLLCSFGIKPLASTP